jgi:hypothetical protein
MATVETRHPTLTPQRLKDWALCRDAYEGEGDIKAAGVKYLPLPSGYATHSDGGTMAYASYQERAQFPDIMAPSVGAMVGIIHAKEIAVDLPDTLEFLHENIDGKGTTLVDFHKEITRQLLIAGRYGVLADAPEGGGDPYLAGYLAETIINWDTGFFVLDESGMIRDGFQWNHVDQYRVLQMDGATYTAQVYLGGGMTDVTPTRQGGGFLNRLPFAVASAKDMGPECEAAPMVGIARAAKAIYQLSADYRLQLFMSGQETLAAINAQAPDQVGAGVVVEIMGNGELPADLKYVSPSCSGIEAHLKAMEHNRDAAVQSGARLFEQSQQSQESGTARKMRFRSESANLMTIAQASCSLLEKSLRNVAMILNQSDAVQDAIIVPAPKDLLDATMTPDEAAALWQLVLAGGLADETYYERIQAGGIASDERTYDDERKLISEAQDRADGLLPRDAPLTE